MITKTVVAFVREPFSMVMLLLALVTLANGLFGPEQRLLRRLAFILLASMSGVTAWMMATNFQWPR